jgi:hypothetical protein
MATQLEIVRLIAPEFVSVSDEDVQKFLDLAPLFIDPALVPEDRRGIALALKACSLMVSRSDSANGLSHGGELTVEKEGDLQRSFSSGGDSKTGRKNIYETQLDAIYAGVLGGSIVTRYGFSGEVR